MKVLIVSDTHNRYHFFEKALERVQPIDLLIHLGDFEDGEDYIRALAHCPTEIVSGNNDFFTGVPKEKMIQVGKYKIMLTHGHRYGVNSGINGVLEAAKRNGADIVMHGHTHVPMINLTDNVWVINPGSISFPRQQGRIPSFIIMDIDTRGDVHFTLNYVKETE